MQKPEQLQRQMLLPRATAPLYLEGIKKGTGEEYEK
jgi:hypothetical protein